MPTGHHRHKLSKFGGWLLNCLKIEGPGLTVVIIVQMEGQAATLLWLSFLDSPTCQSGISTWWRVLDTVHSFLGNVMVNLFILFKKILFCFYFYFLTKRFLFYSFYLLNFGVGIGQLWFLTSLVGFSSSVKEFSSRFFSHNWIKLN